MTKGRKNSQHKSHMHCLNRIWSYILHQITAWNTHGEGIHSPYLFQIVENVIYDRNAYYLFPLIEKQRQVLLKNEQTIFVTDFGTKSSEERSIKRIARNALETERIDQILFKMVNFTHAESILELGTCLGISSAYLAGGNTRGHVTTFEGSSEFIKIAKSNWQKLGVKNLTTIIGDIDTTLPKWLSTNNQTIDFVFLDANHTKEATQRYVNWLLPQMNKKSILVIDDIYHSTQMTQAWQWIKNLPQVTSTMDLFHIGIAFFDPDFLRKNYRLRI